MATFKNGGDCITVIANDLIPYMKITPTGTPGQYRYFGIAADVIDIIAKHYGFCYNFVGTPTDTYQETVEKLSRSEGDISGCFLGVDDKRLKIIDFSIFYLDEHRIVYERPVLTSDMAGFTKPFTIVTWFSILASLFATFVVTSLVLKISEFSSGPTTLGSSKNDEVNSPAAPGGRPRNESLFVHAQKSLLWIVRVILAQAVPVIPLSNSVRVLAGLWFIGCLIINSVYKSNLKAMLIAPKIIIPFNSLEELVRTDYPVFVIENSLLHRIILKAPDSMALGKVRKQLRSGSDQTTALLQGLRGEFAISAFKTGLAKMLDIDFSMDGKCNVYMISNGFLGPMSTGFAFPKNSTLKPLIDKAAHSLREFGILDRLMEKALRNATDCAKPITTSATTSNDLRPLGVGDFYGAFSLYAGCVIIACMVFLSELLMSTKKMLKTTA